MGMTISEKILAQAAGKSRVHAGEIIWATPDVALMHDLLGPVLIEKSLQKLGGRLYDPEKVVVVSDHCAPPASVEQAEVLKTTRSWAREHDIKYFYEFRGACHQVLVDYGHVRPGRLIVGTDSHTCTAGALGAFGTGIGSTEMLGVLTTGEIWLKVPETVLVKWQGELSAGVMAKDMALKTIGTIGHAGATYQAVEFTGEAVKGLSLDERLVLTNMAVEMGAKTGIIEPDDQVVCFLQSLGIENFSLLNSDPDAVYTRSLEFNAAELEPQVACPHEVDNVKPVAEVEGLKIDQAYLGSCTGGRLNDLRWAARILKGKKVSRQVRCLVVPASQEVWKQALREGILEVLVEAGCIISAPACGACGGV
ncbi:3-isopropylmalate dehydratase large subunit, partial [Calderihabitans maritimus]|uniref:3-isopropylmalate dehydratase large subunit n=1 Tax=Calderihabitans maritimus TaxID=1246530 RepID=UPI0018641EDB